MVTGAGYEKGCDAPRVSLLFFSGNRNEAVLYC